MKKQHALNVDRFLTELVASIGIPEARYNLEGQCHFWMPSKYRFTKTYVVVGKEKDGSIVVLVDLGTSPDLPVGKHPGRSFTRDAVLKLPDSYLWIKTTTDRKKPVSMHMRFLPGELFPRAVKKEIQYVIAHKDEVIKALLKRELTVHYP